MTKRLPDLRWICLVGSLASWTLGDPVRFSGQGYLWGSLMTGDSLVWATKIGYMPQYYWQWEHDQDRRLALEVAWHGFYYYRQQQPQSQIELYRTNLRYNTPRLEVVLGRQQINFGPALLLRSLRWFDELDPRDPLKLVSGIDGGRLKYTFANNSNVWLWGLYGNEQRKGYEMLPTAGGTPEFGGRFQMPLRNGELALTAHERQVQNLVKIKAPEFRLALDGRWDIGPGIWFESVAQVTDNARRLPTYRRVHLTTLGGDYTLGIGNGVYLALEYWYCYWQKVASLPEIRRSVTALMASYLLSLWDNLSVFAFYDWEASDFYPFVTWQRTYDKLLFNLSVYHYPAAAYATENLPMAGTGLQLMLIYNH
jgi:hypothetical protein